jgi:drug/metabolite transporter (DMT)-like permease
MAQQTEKDNTRLQYALVCLAPAVWGASGVLVRWTHLGGHEQVLIFWRSCFAVGFVTIIMFASGRRAEFRPRGQTLMLVASGLITAAFAMCVFKAYNLLPIGVATFILYLFPVLVAVMAPLLLKEPTERTTLLCLAIALGGTGLLSWSRMSGAGASSAKGLILAFGSAFFWALLVVLWKKLRETTSPLTIELWTNAVAAVVCAGFALPATGLVTPRAWVVIAVFGTVSFGGASLAYIYALKGVKAQDAALLSYIEPVSAMILGFIALGERPGWQDLVGAALIVAAGALLLRLRTAEKKTQPAAEVQVSAKAVEE